MKLHKNWSLVNLKLSFFVSTTYDSKPNAFILFNRTMEFVLKIIPEERRNRKIRDDFSKLVPNPSNRVLQLRFPLFILIFISLFHPDPLYRFG